MITCPKCGAELCSLSAPHRGWMCGSTLNDCRERYDSLDVCQASTCRIRQLEQANARLAEALEDVLAVCPMWGATAEVKQGRAALKRHEEAKE